MASGRLVQETAAAGGQKFTQELRRKNDTPFFRSNWLQEAVAEVGERREEAEGDATADPAPGAVCAESQSQLAVWVIHSPSMQPCVCVCVPESSFVCLHPIPAHAVLPLHILV